LSAEEHKKGGAMGDKGKKDKDKHQKQKQRKDDQDKKKKLDKQQSDSIWPKGK
jgi:hypothetical protein